MPDLYEYMHEHRPKTLRLLVDQSLSTGTHGVSITRECDGTLTFGITLDVPFGMVYYEDLTHEDH